MPPPQARRIPGSFYPIWPIPPLRIDPVRIGVLVEIPNWIQASTTRRPLSGADIRIASPEGTSKDGQYPTVRRGCCLSRDGAEPSACLRSEIRRGRPGKSGLNGLGRCPVQYQYIKRDGDDCQFRPEPTGILSHSSCRGRNGLTLPFKKPDNTEWRGYRSGLEISLFHIDTGR